MPEPNQASTRNSSLEGLARRIVDCERCPRLRDHCARIARTRRRAFQNEEYWGRPVPGFGDAQARLFIIGLAPGAHGANRTGRVFTGDSSGEWLYAALHEAGFSNGAVSQHRNDKLQLQDAWITCAARCAPPGNRPSVEELAACRPYLVEELQLFADVRVILALGKIAHDSVLRAGEEIELLLFEKRPQFAHGAEAYTRDERIVLLSSYHPSRQNTQTGRLTRTMFQERFTRAREILNAHSAMVR
ncbi:MAG TPA: uracil-DNA glycosylase [bacterium]|nr:uracil-DNA glycosylase [bacterium]